MTIGIDEIIRRAKRLNPNLDISSPTLAGYVGDRLKKVDDESIIYETEFKTSETHLPTLK